MNTVLKYVDVFYNKRYLLEKEARINTLVGVSKLLDTNIIDIPEEDIVEISPLTDYDLITTHGSDLPYLAKSVVLEKKNTMPRIVDKTLQNSALQGILR